jgi:azobenzene reductase
MKILVIGGSPRLHANTRKVAETAAAWLRGKGVSVLEFDVRRHAVPLYNGDEDTYNHPQVKRLIDLATEADGFFICTPEYHNGISGALKNALDYLSGKHFSGKTAAIVAAAGGGKGGINALNNLRLVIRGVGGFVIPEQLVVDPEDIKDDGTLHENVQQRLSSMLDRLIFFTSALRNVHPSI